MSGVVPRSQPYPYSQVEAAFSRHLGFKAIIRCQNVGTQSYLQEVRLCVDNNYHPMECPSQTFEQTNCKTQVIYAPFPGVRK